MKNSHNLREYTFLAPLFIEQNLTMYRIMYKLQSKNLNNNNKTKKIKVDSVLFTNKF